MKRIVLITPLLLVLASLSNGQEYRNIVNSAFDTISNGPQSAIIVDINAAHRDPESVWQKLKFAVHEYHEVINKGAKTYLKSRIDRGLRGSALPFSLPNIAVIREEGRLWRDNSTTGGGGPLVLEFAPDGSAGSFPVQYRQLLQSAFNSATPAINSILGQPFEGGIVRVINVDDSIGDRDAVVGGIYVPDDGTGVPAILFPVYNAAESAVINFVHCLCLATIGKAQFDYDAWNEGFARAAVLQIARINALPPGLDQELINQVIEASYDNSARYSWYNQTPLGNNRFIAPNLKDLPLPPGNSLGGIYLMRYRQVGTAWAKVFTEYPGFFNTFLQRYYQNTAIRGNVPALKTLAQQVLDDLRGAPNSTVEGKLFADWYRNQWVLDTSVTRGRKMFVEAIPITFGLTGDDFGVFAIWATFFETLANGNESLLSGTSFPLFWDRDFIRLTTAGQDDRMDIAGAFGSVTPNFPDIYGFGQAGQWYRVTVELPANDSIGRTLVPAGAIATATDPTPKNFYGTVMGFDGSSTGGDPTIGGIVRLTIPGVGQFDAPLKNGAFSFQIPSPGLNAPRAARYDVIRISNGIEEPPLLSGFVNTWGPELALDIRIGNQNSVGPMLLPAGVQMIGFPVRPFESDMSLLFGIPFGQTLAARWRQDKFDYDRWPSLEPFDIGKGFYVRLPSSQPSFTTDGIAAGAQPYSLALRPGWNQITNPFNIEVVKEEITVQRAAESPRTFAEAVAEGWIGTEIFTFIPGAPDPNTGIPEGGTLVPASSFLVGQGVFVRALVAEGVTLTFRPGSRGRGQSHEQTVQPDWRGTLRVSGLHKEASQVQFGQAVGATHNIDRAIDSEIPPIWGGAVQAYLSDGVMAYRNIKDVGRQSWTIQVTGLRPGVFYRLNFGLAVHRGRAPLLQITDLNNGQTRALRTGFRYSFRATGTDRTFRIHSYVQGDMGQENGGGRSGRNRSGGGIGR